jgi:hypothetical protein
MPERAPASGDAKRLILTETRRAVVGQCIVMLDAAFVNLSNQPVAGGQAL